MNLLMPIGNITNITDIIKYIWMIILIHYISFKIINKIDYIKENKFKMSISIFIVCIIYVVVRSKTDFLCSALVLILILTLELSKNTRRDIIDSLINVIISLGINYALLSAAIAMTYVLNYIFKLNNDFIIMFFILVIYTFFIYLITRVKRFKNGFSFLQKSFGKGYFEILIFNVCAMIVFSGMILPNYGRMYIGGTAIGIFIFAIIMFFTIIKSFQLYYKQNLLIKELEETKKELDEKKQEVEQLEKENLEFSKTSHSLAHKQRSLEYKLNQLIQKGEMAEEIDIKDRVKELSKELYNKPQNVELAKTGITEIDDMLKYMQSECIKNNIDFELQLNGNIHQMINNYITKEELEILLADHIKDAIIAINHSDNINRSIFVRLGKIDGIYSLYIYDSGIEFEKETLENLGKKPVTTHKDDGGTGMGFMNTFDTLKKNKASLTIKEIGKPCKDNYTKVIIIECNGKEDFNIVSYR